MKNYERELEFARQVVVSAYEEEGKNRSFSTIAKGERDFATSVDLSVEARIVEHIREDFPGDDILAEENHTTDVNHSRFWCLDPIDGTVNFSRGLPLYGVQLALVEDGRPVVGCIYLPALNELYWASRGEGSFVNGNPIRVSRVNKIQKALISMGDFSKKDGQDEANARWQKAINSLAIPAMKLKIFGAACVDMSYLSRGYVDAHVMFGFGLWDILPGLIIAEEAGAVYKTGEGHPFDLSAQTFASAATPSLLEDILQRLQAGGF